MISVDARRCPQNHHCPAVRFCRFDAITQRDKNALPQVDREKCTGCGTCISFCPMGAIQEA